MLMKLTTGKVGRFFFRKQFRNVRPFHETRDGPAGAEGTDGHALDDDRGKVRPFDLNPKSHLRHLTICDSLRPAFR